MSCQNLVTQNIEHHKPPCERDTAAAHAHGRVDKQLCQIVRTGHQLEPASTWYPMGESLHLTYCRLNIKGFVLTYPMMCVDHSEQLAGYN